MKGVGSILFACLALIFLMYGGQYGPNIREAIIYHFTGEKVWLVRMED